ncbi:hypothetical protein DCAR_0935622 [Daucus carota subsp. sativus]|uniref:Cyclic nucleotide-binding domain-containing protein n=1 Tax=Daucus carota subsp. sativus TaxID=79200 RepID=A0A175YIM7_DAUCS|nr:PREDICTED: probable cyclic nucleotide-gated ion channel 20, chloroplastic [Daucus carota subsp. sativus]WOH16073.1 hypothetical protein DCAR_0935622 [Daucus carota subsp. sativus]
MNELKRNKALRHNASAIAIPMPVNSPPSDDLTSPNDVHTNRPFHALRRRMFSWVVINPNSRNAQIWGKFLYLFFIYAFLLQTTFVFLQAARQDRNCISLVDYELRITLYILNKLNDIIFLLHILIKFKMASVDLKTRVLVYDPKKVALNYMKSYFFIDLFLIVPVFLELVQYIIIQTKWSNETTRAFLFLQNLAVLCRLLSSFGELPVSAYFDSLSTIFLFSNIAFFLFTHAVGVFWYYFALSRVEECLKKACGKPWCFDLISCEPAYEDKKLQIDLTSLNKWKNNKNATACFGPGGYNYGIYVQAVSLMRNSDIKMRYIYSLSWGFQQISTLAGNQIPAFSFVEVLFTIFITVTGLLLFSFLIGNMQSHLQALSRRRLENSVRSSEIELWMSHRLFPDELKAKIRESERYNWVATRGLNELMLLENLPEDLQRDIRRHLLKFDKSFPVVALMDESILDAIRERMKQKTYMKGNRVLVRGGLIDKMVYIVRGKLESISEDENVYPLSEGDVCGAELITLCLEHYVLNRDNDKFRIPAGKLVSKRTVRCLTNVEAFTLRAADLEDVFSLYSGLLIQNPLVQGAITKESLHPKSLLRSRSY